jgi:hypothetical protein
MGDQARGASAAKRAAQFDPEVLRPISLQACRWGKGSAGSGSGVMQLTVVAVAKDADPSTKG